MATISVSLPSDGTTADVSDYNTPINTIVTEFNGNIDNNNIKSGAAIAGSKLASSSVTATQIDFGGSGTGVWWQEIARGSLSGAADTITVSSIPARKYLKIICNLVASGSISAHLTFNGDTAANYAYQLLTNGTASSGASQTSLFPEVTQTGPMLMDFMVLNIATEEKLVTGTTMGGAAGATNVPSIRSGQGKWVNTSAQISSVTFTNTSTGDYASGTEVIILGHD